MHGTNKLEVLPARASEMHTQKTRMQRERENMGLINVDL